MLNWQEEGISKKHEKDTFDCTDEDLNTFLKKYARQAHEKGSSKTYVASIDNRVIGFYTLSPASIKFDQAPSQLQKGMPRHDIPVFRLAKLAVDKKYQNQGLGGQLLLKAGIRCMNVAAIAGGVALLIDAKNEAASRWYQSYGAIPFKDSPLTLVIPFATIKSAVLQMDKNAK